MVKKVVASLVLVGSLAIGSAGVAAAAASSDCSNAPATIARLQAEEAQVASALASLQAKTVHGRHGASRLEREVDFLTRAEARLASRVSKLQSRCPSKGGSGGGIIA
jgi:hypothetical protein